MKELSDLQQWIAAIAVPQDNLGGMAICPYANLAARFKMHRVQGEIIPPVDRDWDVLVYLLPETISLESMVQLCNDLNVTYKDLVFLPDHRHRRTELNGVQTNNGVHNIILCQPRQKLQLARAALSKTAYYTYMSDEYRRELWGADYVDMD